MESSARSMDAASPSRQAASWASLKGLFGPASRLDAASEGAHRVVRLLGPLDGRVAAEIKAQARAFAEGEGTGWSLDLSGVSTWDAEGLQALVYALDVTEIAGKQLTLVNPGRALRHTLELANLHRMFAIDDRDA